MTLKFHKFLATAEAQFVQNFIKLSAVVYELPC